MKIGIFTLPLENNYGGNLQNFAMQQVLKDMGHDVYTIDWHRQNKYGSLLHQLLGFLRRLYRYFVKKENVSICWSPFFSQSEFDVISSKIRPFIEKNIKLTRRVSKSQLQAIDDEYKFDGYVVGSDQVWVHSYALSAFLDFVERNDVVKVAYAASSNERAWTRYPELTAKCRRLSESFTGLSVREKFLQEESEKLLNRKVELVLDPIFLLGKEKYEELIPLKNNNTDFCFEYVLDKSEEKMQIVQRISEELKLPFRSGMPTKAHIRERHMNLSDFIFPSVEEWLFGISHAKFVVTDSFHGMAFCILFNKQFVVIANAKRGMGRFKSLLETFGLVGRMVNNPKEASAVLKTPIDYLSIYNKISKLRMKSIDYLRKSLQS